MFAYVFKTRADPFAGRINLFRVYQGTLDARLARAQHARPRQGAHRPAAGPAGQGGHPHRRVRAGGHRRRRQAQGDARRRLAGRARPADLDALDQAARARDGVLDRGQGQGRRGQGLHRPAPPAGGGPDDRPAPRPADRRADRRRALADPRRGRRRPPEGALRGRGRRSSRRASPTRRRSAAAPRRTGATRSRPAAAASSATATSRSSRSPSGDFEFVNAIKGGVIPTGFIPAVEKGVLEAMAQGAVAGYPVKGVRVTLYDGSYHTVDSSEMAFKLAGSLAMRQALEHAGAVLLEPIMLVTASVPDESVGDVMGDLSSRRGRPLGTEAVGGMTEVKAEVPMAEMLTYAPDLRSITGGQGEYTLEFLRYEEVPAHLAQKVIEAKRGRPSEVERGLRLVRLRPGAGYPLRRGAGALLRSRPVMPSTRDIRTNQVDISCDVCGRTLLRGEQPETFLAGGAAPPGVRAVHRARPARGVDPRVRRRRPAAAFGAQRPPAALVRRTASAATAGRARRSRPSRPRAVAAAGGAGARARRLTQRTSDAARRRPRSPTSRRASRATCAPCRRTPSSRCSGRSRSSTAPSTCARSAASRARSGRPPSWVRPLGDRPSVVSIAVMWELSWYRYEIDLSEEAHGVRRAAQGDELSELPARGPGRQRRGRRARRARARPARPAG